MTVVVIGAGAFGTALAIALAQGGRQVTLVARDAATVRQIQQTRESPRLPGVPMPTQVSLTADPSAISRARAVLLAVPMQTLTRVLADLPATPAPLVACCKGVDLTTGQGPSDVIATHHAGPIAVLTGPSFARDIAQGLPTALTLACADPGHADQLQSLLSTSSLRLYTTQDVKGAELGGALKNVMAIACGAAIGAGLGDSARAALMTRGFAEMLRYAQSRGSQPETLNGLSGLGDLALTCTSDLSRNYCFGLSLGRGTPPDPTMTVEGVATARAMAALAGTGDLDLPICQAVAGLVTGTLTVDGALQTLISRPLKKETA